MKKLYLIRRNLESFAGPMTLNDMRHEYKRMAFGLQDEVSGHVGPWVSFDDIDKLRRYYPEVAKVVHDEMFAGWGVSEHTAQRLVTKDKKKPAPRAAPRQRNLGLAVACIIIAIFAFAAAIYLATGSKYSGKLIDGPRGIDITDINKLTDAEDYDGAVLYMKRNLQSLLPSVSQNSKNLGRWLPHLRLYAFANEGWIDGVGAKQLRGSGAVVAPPDCSLTTWKKRWRQSSRQWQGYLEGRSLTKAHWARILAWDPHWIRSREQKGWIKPQNYFVGCLDMASKALAEVIGENQAETAERNAEIASYGPGIQRRLQWLLEISQTGRSSLTSESGGQPTLLTTLTCWEQARSNAEFEACRTVTPGTEAIRKYLEERAQLQQLRMAFLGGNPLPADALARLNSIGAIAPKSDTFTRFDYKPELRLVKVLVKQEGAMQKAAGRVKEDFPEFNPRY